MLTPLGAKVLDEYLRDTTCAVRNHGLGYLKLSKH